MKLDPSSASGAPVQLGGGATDAAQGQRAERAGAEAQRESAFEPVDALLLRRLRAASMHDAATSVTTAADAKVLAERTRELMHERSNEARAAHADVARERLRELLSGW